MTKSNNLQVLLILLGAVALSVQGDDCDCNKDKVCECFARLNHELKEGTFYKKLIGRLEVTLTYINSNMDVAVGFAGLSLNSGKKLTMPYENKPVCGQINTSQRPRVDLCVFLSHVENTPKRGHLDRLIDGELHYYITYGEKKLVPDRFMALFDMNIPEKKL